MFLWLGVPITKRSTGYFAVYLPYSVDFGLLLSLLSIVFVADLWDSPFVITVFENEEDKPSLDTAKELVGGWVQLLPCPRHPDWQMLVNEEGKLHGLPYNQEASDICSKDIVGHAVLLKGAACWT